MKKILFLSFLLLSFQAFSQQITVQILDRQTENPVPFVKMNDGVGKTFVADIDGKITTEINASHSYSFRFFEYKDTVISGADLIRKPVLFLTPDAQVYTEIVVTPGENPAHRIIQNVIDKKKENDPLRNNSFTYDSYSKLYVTGELKEGVIRDTITDSSMIEALDLLDRQYLFLVETKAKRDFNPPSYDKEEILSYNVSGVKEPLFATLVNQFQSFSFYDNTFELNQQEFVNPLAPGTFRRYLFVLEDTLFNNQGVDTTYIVSYRPRAGKNFKGLNGYLYINTKDWALERVITSPYETNGMASVKITQEYAYTNNKKWFPKKISTEIYFPIQLKNYGSIIGRSSLYIRDVEFDVELKKGFNPVSVEIADGALADSTSLHEFRGDTYTGKEELTYVTVDSVAREMNFERTLELLKIASTGKIPVGVISFPIRRVISYNSHEKIRLGLGIETNERLSKWFQIGGYFAYGFGDKEWKWSGDLSFTLHQKNQIKLNFQYSDDLSERGGTEFFNKEFELFTNGISREYYKDIVDRERKAKVSVSGMIRQNIQAEAYVNYSRFTFLDDYAYIPLFSDNGTDRQFDNAEAGIILNWNIRERVMMLEQQRFSLGTKWPRLTIKAAKGINGMFDSRYDYYRFNLDILQRFKFRNGTSLSLMSRNGMTLGNVPINLIHAPIGTGRSWNPSIINTFETMRPGEFFTDRYTSLFVRYTFLPIKNKTTWTEPLFGLHTAVGVGDIRNITDHRNFDFKTFEKGYYESGVLLDNIIKAQFIGMGIGVFYRYGPNQLDAVKDNFFYKISFRFDLGN